MCRTLRCHAGDVSTLLVFYIIRVDVDTLKNVVGVRLTDFFFLVVGLFCVLFFLIILSSLLSLFWTIVIKQANEWGKYFGKTNKLELDFNPRNNWICLTSTYLLSLNIVENVVPV